MVIYKNISKSNQAGQHVVAAIKAARLKKGLSQRALADAARMQQSHIAKIEGGATDVQLSSLVNLARALDLEIMLVPRKLVPAVQTIIQSRTAESPQNRGEPGGARPAYSLDDENDDA